MTTVKLILFARSGGQIRSVLQSDRTERCRLQKSTGDGFCWACLAIQIVGLMVDRHVYHSGRYLPVIVTFQLGGWRIRCTECGDPMQSTAITDGSGKVIYSGHSQATLCPISIPDEHPIIRKPHLDGDLLETLGYKIL